MTNEFNISFINYVPEYKEGILNLLAFMWYEYDYSGRQALFNWRYEKNPYEKPVIYVALHNGVVIGFRAFISQIFIKNSKTLLVFSPADTIVHPNYRRKGIISTLNNKCLEQLNLIYSNSETVLINTSTSKPSMPVYLNQGWQKSNGLRRFYFKFTLINYFKSNKKNDTNPLVDGASVWRKNYKIEITNKIKSVELSEFNNRIQRPEKWSNIRDINFFEWRYSYQPERYTGIYCYFNNQLQGYLVLKRLTEKKYSLDQFEACSIKVFKLMLRTAVKKLRILQLRSYAFLPEEKKAIIRSGFIPEPIFIIQRLGHLRFPVLVRPITILPDEKDFILDGKDIRKIENWHIQIADRH